jgi:hypothetical protein
MDKTALLKEASYYCFSFIFGYLSAMVAAHGPNAFVVDYGCIVAAAGTLGIFHFGSGRTPNTIMKAGQ